MVGEKNHFQSLAGLNERLCDCVTASHPTCVSEPDAHSPPSCHKGTGPLTSTCLQSNQGFHCVCGFVSVPQHFKNDLKIAQFCSVSAVRKLCTKICTCHLQVKTQTL